MNYYLDYENTNKTGFKGLEYLNENDMVYIFYSSHVPTAPRYYERIIRKNNIRVETRRLFQVGKNGLDFYIASQVGADILKSPVAIISKDTGYQAVQDYWERISPERKDIILGETIEEAIMKCQNSIGEYVRDSLELIPIEALKNEVVKVHTKAETIESKIKTEADSAFDNEGKKINISEDMKKELIQYLLTNGAKLCYAFCIKNFGADAPEIYQTIKEDAMPFMVTNADFMEISEALSTVGEAAAKRICKKKYGRSFYENAFKYVLNSVSNIKEEPELEEVHFVITEDESPVIEKVAKADEYTNYDMYGSVEAIGIAGCILKYENMDSISIADVINDLSANKKKNTTNYYFGAFRGVKNVDIKASIQRLSKTGCYNISDDKIVDLNKDLLKAFENPIAYEFQNNGSYENYKDIDWIDLMHSGVTLKSEDWAKILPMFKRIFLLSMFHEDICGFIRRAPKSFMKKLTQEEKRSNGTKAHLIGQVIRQVGKAA